MVDKKKVANNILEFLLDPTVIPVTQRLYFGPGERLQNDYYTNAKADAYQAYGDQKHNSDFYPQRNRQQSQREASVMDRKTVIASMDILAQNFAEDDPIAKDLRTMAYAIEKMGEDNFQARMAAKTFKCPTCGTKVLEQTSFCVKCKKKVKNPAGTDKKADQNDPHFMYTGAPAGGNSPATPAPQVSPEQVGAMKPLGTPATSGAAPAPAAAPAAPEGAKQYASNGLGKWSKKATDLVRQALISEVVVADGADAPDADDKPADDKPVDGKPDAKAPEAPVAKDCMAAAPVAPVKTAEDAPMAPAAAPIPEGPKDGTPVEEAPAKKDDKEATVDTSILGCDMSMPFMTAEDVGVLADDERLRLESIMGSGIDLTAEQKEKLGM